MNEFVYIHTAMVGNGYDSLELLVQLSEKEVTELAEACGMKPGWKAKFVRALEKYKISEMPPPSD